MTELLLRIKNIKKQYRDKKNIIDAVKGISLDIYKGEIFGLLGPNGAGKTTLSSMIASLHPPTSGDDCAYDVRPNCSISSAARVVIS